MEDNRSAAVMIPPFGAQPVPPKKYVAANDNYAGMAPLAETTFGPLEQYEPSSRSPFIQIYPGRKFWPWDPRPEDVTIGAIAHGLSNLCRYSGAVTRFYSVAEHSTLIARWLAVRTDPVTALCGLLHDAPEALSGFGDVSRPVKGRAPVIAGVEDAIWRKAIAPKFGLPIDMPREVHDADTRITADEAFDNLTPMDWQYAYDKPLGVNIRCWSPEKAEQEFLATFRTLMNGRG